MSREPYYCEVVMLLENTMYIKADCKTFCNAIQKFIYSIWSKEELWWQCAESVSVACIKWAVKVTQ